MRLIAADLVQRVEAMVECMSRCICVDIYTALINLRLEWVVNTPKVVKTSSAEDGPEW